MQPSRLYGFPFVLFSVLITAPMVVFLFALQFSIIFKPLPKYSDPNALPWEEWPLIRNKTLYAYGMHKRQKYSPEQPRFRKTIPFEAKVYQEQYQRGEIEFKIYRNGGIKGFWYADFTSPWRRPPQIHYTTLRDTGGHFVSNTFRGNIAPSKVYLDEHGQDESKLYIIAEGQYLLMMKNLENNDARKIFGNMYLTGWIDPNFNAIGELTFTPTLKSWKLESWRKSLQSFYWETNPLD